MKIVTLTAALLAVASTAAVADNTEYNKHGNYTQADGTVVVTNRDSSYATGSVIIKEGSGAVHKVDGVEYSEANGNVTFDKNGNDVVEVIVQRDIPAERAAEAAVNQLATDTGEAAADVIGDIKSRVLSSTGG